MSTSRRYNVPVSRRAFLGAITTTVLMSGGSRSLLATVSDDELLSRINASRPSVLDKLPPHFNARFGATHAGGKYCLTTAPFLIEGAERLLQLGTRLGKFWFTPEDPQKPYPFNSSWPRCKTLRELGETEYFARLWAMPFERFVLVTTAPCERDWHKPGLEPGFYDNVSEEYYEFSSFLYQTFRDRRVDIVVQNWEGDWLLRRENAKWNPPSDDWKERCVAMQRWFAARQAGVSRARAEFGTSSRCVVAHAIEVNRVADIWRGLPTVTSHVLPEVEVDLISYSGYDGFNEGAVNFWRCMEEIRSHARTGALYGPGALAIGEFGFPENSFTGRATGLYDQTMGAMLLADVLYAVQWELYCNEVADKKAPPVEAVHDPDALRGYWLVRPDGTLSDAGTYFSALWAHAAAGG